MFAGRVFETAALNEYVYLTVPIPNPSIILASLKSFSVLLSSLYTLPAGCMLFCFVYEYYHLPEWMLQWQEAVCRHPDLGNRWKVPCRYPDGRGPAVVSPQVRIFSTTDVSDLKTSPFIIIH